MREHFKDDLMCIVHGFTMSFKLGEVIINVAVDLVNIPVTFMGKDLQLRMLVQTTASVVVESRVARRMRVLYNKGKAT